MSEVDEKVERACHRLVEECTAVKTGEVCLLVKDLDTSVLHRELQSAILWAGGIPLVLGLPTGVYLCGSLPEGVEASLRSADVVYLCTSGLFPHAARKRAMQAGARVLSLGKVSDEMLPRLDVDYRELARVTRDVVEAFSHTAEIRITSPAGTNIHMQVKDQPVVSFDGLAREPGSASVVPAGVVATLPVPGTVEGTVVLDASVATIGLLSEPVALTVRKGRVTKIEGDEAAEKLQQMLERADDNARCIAETGLGTNPRATYIGNMVEDERVRGSAHIGLGGNVQLGGTIESAVHIDATMRRPSVFLDGNSVVRDGALLVYATAGTPQVRRRCDIERRVSEDPLGGAVHQPQPRGERARE